MMRVLHVADERDAAGGLAGTLALIADAQKQEPGEHRTLLLGGAAIRDAAERVGLVFHKHWPSFRGLARAALAVRRGPRELLAQAERVDCWSVHAAIFAAEAGSTNFNPRFGQVGDTPFARHVSDPSRIGRSAVDACRERWGVVENERVVALLCDRPNESDLAKAALAVALALDACRVASEGTIRLRLLVHPEQRGHAQTQRIYEHAGKPDMLIQEALLACPWQVLPACDVALVIDPACSGLCRVWAELCGTPVIGPAKGNASPDAVRPKVLAGQLARHLLQPVPA